MKGSKRSTGFLRKLIGEGGKDEIKGRERVLVSGESLL